MKYKIIQFNHALNYLKFASRELDRMVEKEIKARKTVNSLQELVLLMPEGYRGTRKIYEQIIILDKSK